jgi:hypothetical protein
MSIVVAVVLLATLTHFACVGGIDHPVATWTDHEALRRQKLSVADHPVARQIARCYGPDVTNAEQISHRGQED